jgi:post-segregation antitoxin (ccd killing protein)
MYRMPVKFTLDVSEWVSVKIQDKEEREKIESNRKENIKPRAAIENSE